MSLTQEVEIPAETEAWWQVAKAHYGRGYSPGRNELPEVLIEHFWELEPEVQRAALIETWSMVEFPMLAIDSYEWAEMFYAVGYLRDGLPVRRPSKLPTLYRAATAEYAVGMSWTDDIETARHFMKLRSNSAVYSLAGESAQPALLAHCTKECRYGRGEPEYILDIDYLGAEMLTVDESE